MVVTSQTFLFFYTLNPAENTGFSKKQTKTFRNCDYSIFGKQPLKLSREKANDLSIVYDYFSGFETGCYVAQADLELLKQPKMTLNS